MIDDPDGFTNLRAERSADSAIVARVKNGEVFKFEVPRWADVRDLLGDELTLSPFEGRAYLKRYFPKTAAILFP